MACPSSPVVAIRERRGLLLALSIMVAAALALGSAYMGEALYAGFVTTTPPLNVTVTTVKPGEVVAVKVCGNALSRYTVVLRGANITETVTTGRIPPGCVVVPVRAPGRPGLYLVYVLSEGQEEVLGISVTPVTTRVVTVTVTRNVTFTKIVYKTRTVYNTSTTTLWNTTTVTKTVTRSYIIPYTVRVVQVTPTAVTLSAAITSMTTVYVPTPIRTTVVRTTTPPPTPCAATVTKTVVERQVVTKPTRETIVRTLITSVPVTRVVQQTVTIVPLTSTVLGGLAGLIAGVVLTLLLAGRRRA